MDPNFLSFLAYDTVLFTEASIKQARIIQECLDHFCMNSSQKVNLEKSQVFFSANTDQIVVSVTLGISTTQDLEKYLGIPTINDRVSRPPHFSMFWKG